jgi:hypothetical protein
MQEFMDVIHNQCANVRGMVCRLQKYSTAFYLLGNEKVSTELEVMAGELYQHQDNIQKELGKELNRQYKQAQQSSVNVFNAALAGIKVVEAEKGRTVRPITKGQPHLQTLNTKGKATK